MNTTVINIKTDRKIKQQAQKVAENLGLSLSGVINAYLRQFVRTKTVFVSTEYREPSDMLKKAFKEAEEDIKNDRAYKFGNAEEAIRFLDNIVSKKKKTQSK